MGMRPSETEDNGEDSGILVATGKCLERSVQH